MNRAKCSSSCKDGSIFSRMITVCNRGRNLLSNQLDRRSNPRKSNINCAFRRAMWPDVIPKLINSFVNGVNNDFLMIPYSDGDITITIIIVVVFGLSWFYVGYVGITLVALVFSWLLSPR